jgi:HJR/Mrr/RecB family endonuclease
MKGYNMLTKAIWKKSKLVFLIFFPLTIAIDFYLLPFYCLKILISRKRKSASGSEMLELENVKDGYQFEEYMAHILKKNGFRDVSTTKKSGDYGVDVLAKKKGSTYAVQCKLYSQPVGLTAVQEVFAGKKYYNCAIAVVATNNTFTSSAIELASKVDVELWDGSKIRSLQQQATRKKR